MRVTAAFFAFALSLTLAAGFVPSQVLADNTPTNEDATDEEIKACIDACFAAAEGPGYALKKCVTDCTKKRRPPVPSYSDDAFNTDYFFRASAKKKTPAKGRNSTSPDSRDGDEQGGKCETYEEGCDRDSGGGPDDTDEGGSRGGDYDSHDGGSDVYGSGF